MLQALLPVIYVAQTVAGGYGVYLCVDAVQHLRQYESASETAAKYSNTAADQLHRTRTTQASALLSVCIIYL
jgi:formate-dependent nitrite reductase membrane component NrfD